MSGAAAPTVVEAAPVPGADVSGSWKGPFLGTQFVFEFHRTAAGWAGRYQSEKYNKWVDLKDVVLDGSTLRFSADSKPSSSFVLRVESGNRTLTGTAAFGGMPTLPLTLARTS